MKFVNALSKQLKLSKDDTITLLKNMEDDVGHDENLIKAMIDLEGEGLLRYLKKKTKKKEQEISKAYA